jgi:hypothetical protein
MRQQVVVKPEKRSLRIILCGHSQGGAIAQIVCKLLIDQRDVLANGVQIQCVTIGAPMWNKWEMGGRGAKKNYMISFNRKPLMLFTI